MPRSLIFRRCARSTLLARIVFATFIFCVLATVQPVAAQSPRDRSDPPPTKPASVARQAKLEAALVEMLSGATLDGSYTSTGPGSDPTKLSHDKYTLGDVRKIADQLWLIEARIQYGDHDVTLPITVPIHWAADTPVIVVDNLGLPQFGTVSARVMFFEGHYAGYWKHGKHGGHLFGVIKPPQPRSRQAADDREPESADQPAGKQVDQ
ncbi:MAG: hypothetical protein WD738_11560 [Pirellulales bacterium]